VATAVGGLFSFASSASGGTGTQQDCSKCNVTEDDVRVCRKCRRHYCKSCCNLSLLKNRCQDGAAHEYIDNLLTLIGDTEPSALCLGSDLPEGFGDAAGTGDMADCSRCGKSTTYLALCRSCNEGYCAGCKSLPATRNQCEAGFKHVFPAKTSFQTPTNHERKEKPLRPDSPRFIAMAAARLLKEVAGAVTVPSSLGPGGHELLLELQCYRYCFTVAQFRVWLTNTLKVALDLTQALYIVQGLMSQDKILPMRYSEIPGNQLYRVVVSASEALPVTADMLSSPLWPFDKKSSTVLVQANQEASDPAAALLALEPFAACLMGSRFLPLVIILHTQDSTWLLRCLCNLHLRWGRMSDLLTSILVLEKANKASTSLSTLFREDSVFLRTLTTFFRFLAKGYLETLSASLHNFIREACDGELFSTEIELLLAATEHFMTVFFKTKIPPLVAFCLSKAADTFRFLSRNDSQSVMTRCISSLLFLRCIVPSLINRDRSARSQDPLLTHQVFRENAVRRTAKIIQSSAAGHGTPNLPVDAPLFQSIQASLRALAGRLEDYHERFVELPKRTYKASYFTALSTVFSYFQIGALDISVDDEHLRSLGNTDGLLDKELATVNQVVHQCMRNRRDLCRKDFRSTYFSAPVTFPTSSKGMPRWLGFETHLHKFTIVFFLGKQLGLSTDVPRWMRTFTAYIPSISLSDGLFLLLSRKEPREIREMVDRYCLNFVTLPCESSMERTIRSKHLGLSGSKGSLRMAILVFNSMGEKSYSWFIGEKEQLSPPPFGEIIRHCTNMYGASI